MKKTKKILSLFLAVAVLIPAMLLVLRFDANANEFAGYTPIYDKYDLRDIGNSSTGNFYLVNDIVFTEEDFAVGGDFYNNGKGWIPLTGFRGTLDGDGHTIYGLQINMPEGDYYLTHYGALFGTAEGATFKNITMKGGEVRVAKNEFRSAYAASLVGWADDTDFLYCHNYNNIYCEYAGGIVAHWSSGSMTGCTNRGEIAPLNSDDATTYGGLISKTPENNEKSLSVTKCANYGRIYSGTDSSLYCGGIIGSSYSPNIVIDNCANTADIGASTSVMSGGIVGTAIGGSISYCYNTGNISGGGAGGIVGGNGTDSSKKVCKITNCYNTGDITLSKSYLGYAGGIAGTRCDIRYCYNSGTVKSTVSGTQRYGAISGMPYVIVGCYSHNDQTYAVSNSTNIVTKEDLKNQNTYSSFDFVDVWGIAPDMNDGYPYLRKTLLNFDTDNVEIKLYSEVSTGVIGKNQAVSAHVQLESNGQIMYGSMLYKNFEFEISVLEDGIIAITDLVQEDDGLHFTITGLEKGTATLIVEEKTSGASVQSKIDVTNGIIFFNADAMPTYYDSKKPYNAYIDGIFIDSFSSNEYDDHYAVSFDAYNTTPLTGMVEIYDKNGTLVDIVPIKRFANINVTSMGETVFLAARMVWDLFEGDLATYQGSDMSVRTPIRIEVPKGGTINITNNITSSAACALYNYTEFIFESITLFTDILKKHSETEIAKYNEHVASELLRGYIDFMNGESSDISYVNLANNLMKEFLKLSGGRITLTGLKAGIKTFIDTGIDIMEMNGINYVLIMARAAHDFGLSVTQDIILQSFASFGLMLDAAFQFSKCVNHAAYYVALHRQQSIEAFIIQFSGNDGELCDNGSSIKLPTQHNELNYVFTSQVWLNEQLSAGTKETLESLANDSKYTVVDMSLLYDGEPAECPSEVTVAPVIPGEYKKERCLVFAINDDGSLTLQQSSFESGELTFTTEELESYAIIELPEDIYRAFSENRFGFSGASVTLGNDITLNYKVNATPFESGYLTNPYVVFECNGETLTVSSYAISDGKYVFDFSSIAPYMMGDTVRATLYAYYGETLCNGITSEYSVAEYCANILSKYSGDENTELRTLIVDMLIYGEKSQICMNYKTDALVTSILTLEQRALASSENTEPQNAFDTDFKTVESASVSWIGADMNLNDSLAMIFTFAAESIDGLCVKVVSGDEEWTIPYTIFTEIDTDTYRVYFTEFNVTQMNAAVQVTVYDGETPISNTLQYSIGSYAATAIAGDDNALKELALAMIRYSSSAYAYTQQKET